LTFLGVFDLLDDEEIANFIQLAYFVKFIIVSMFDSLGECDVFGALAGLSNKVPV
jgi:hypothetical protein